uniref:Transducin n=1 Tax=Romanomermis culicivorax TaxID=13658 RepID=A0A915ITX8_ROMCU
MFVACLDGSIEAWDSKSGQKVRQWTGHGGEILDFTFDSDHKFIITASSDQTSKVFAIENLS